MVDSSFPIAVALAAIIHENKILLIKRVKDGFEGCWSLPGGKVRRDEHLSQAAIREAKEETGIDAALIDHLGYVSEHQVFPEGIKHVILHICELEPSHLETVEQETEGMLSWFDLDRIAEARDTLIPSDYLMIEHMIKARGGGCYDCVIEVSGSGHALKKFQQVGRGG